MTLRRAAFIAALAAAVVYIPASGNHFALDDGAIVERNAAAHSVPAALAAFGHPYWPPEHGAGLWRPVVILSFAVDWQISDGNTTWLHVTNIALHVVATLLVVLVMAPYVSAAGALAGGLLFALHPVHVEAVANLVGRAEVLVVCFLMVALLLARRVRRLQSEGRRTALPEAAMLAAVALAMLSKEHAVVAVALLWLDDRARGEAPGRLPARDYAMVVMLTVVWLLVRRLVEGGAGFDAVAPTFFHLGVVGRLSTMFPAVLVLMRLLVWPFDLSPDYHPLVIERLEHPTATGVAGLVLLVAVILLAVLLWGRHRTTSLGLLVLGLAWLPTSNLFFPSGIVLAERTLYLSSVGLALMAGAGVDALRRRLKPGHLVLLGAAACLVLGARTWTRSPVWRSTRDLVISALLEHPESYKVHQSAARVFWRLGMRANALAEYRVAEEIYALDQYLLAEKGSAELEAGYPRQALATLLRAERLDSIYSLSQQLLAQALLRIDSAGEALRHGRIAVAVDPTSAESARMMAASFVATGQVDSAVGVWRAFEARGGNAFDRWLLAAVTWAAVARPDSATPALERARQALPSDTTAERRFGEASELVAHARAGPRAVLR